MLDKNYGHKLSYSVSDENRIGDHICYYSDLGKFKTDYPEWDLSYSIDKIFDEIVAAQLQLKA